MNTSSLGPHVKYQSVDPEQKPDVAKQYGATHMGDLIASSGSRTERIEAGVRGQVGEEDVTTALIKMTRDKSKMVCFLTGHGEKSVSDTSDTGYSSAEQGLKKESYTDKTVNLITDNGVPSDCDVLVIPGPTQSFVPAEGAMISKYLAEGGQALIEVDPETDPKLQDTFQAWNIKVGDNVVIDASGMGQLIGAGPGIPLVTTFGPSPITKGFAGGMTYFPLARTVSIADTSKTDPEAVELLKTSAAQLYDAQSEREEDRLQSEDRYARAALARRCGQSQIGRQDRAAGCDWRLGLRFQSRDQRLSQRRSFLQHDQLARAGRESDLDSAEITGESAREYDDGTRGGAPLARPCFLSRRCDSFGSVYLVEATVEVTARRANGKIETQR